MLYLTHREKKTRVLGPGLRYALWLQGCKKRCAGCINPAGQRIGEGGYWMTEEAIIDELAAAKSLTGITISGGEPFLQAEGLASLVRLVRERTCLDIMIYTGYTLAELNAMESPEIHFILAHIDLLIDGEYREEENRNAIYRGSDNQVIHYLSPKYEAYKERIEKTKNRSIEFVYRGGQDLFLVGIPAKNTLEDLWKRIKKIEQRKGDEHP